MKSTKRKKPRCCHCGNKIQEEVYNFSIQHYEIPLCLTCQEDFKNRIKKATPIAVKLYQELKKRGVPAELEKWDGHKTIDIAVVAAKVNIEVDGGQHNYNAKQALSDLQRTLLSFKKGYLTLRIPNSLVDFDIDNTANLITEFVMESYEQLIKEDDDDWDDDY